MFGGISDVTISENLLSTFLVALNVCCANSDWNCNMCGKVLVPVAIDRLRMLLFGDAAFNRFDGNLAWAIVGCISCFVESVKRRLYDVWRALRDSTPSWSFGMTSKPGRSGCQLVC